VSLLALLLAFLFPGVDDPEPTDPVDAAPDATDEVDDSAEEIDASAADDKPEDKPDPTLARVSEAERIAREAQEQVQRLQQQAQRPDPLLDEEERKLRDPNTSDLEKWQIQSNRALRASQHQSQQALFQAQDMADKTAYTTKGITNPIYSKYADRVESELAKARANNSNVPREVILQLLIGRDMLAGQFKAKPAAAPVSRGKPNAARSDVSRRGSQSEHDKRRARLENQIL
jgi:hypothetical protein